MNATELIDPTQPKHFTNTFQLALRAGVSPTKVSALVAQGKLKPAAYVCQKPVFDEIAGLATVLRECTKHFTSVDYVA